MSANVVRQRPWAGTDRYLLSRFRSEALTGGGICIMYPVTTHDMTDKPPRIHSNNRS